MLRWLLLTLLVNVANADAVLQPLARQMLQYTDHTDGTLQTTDVLEAAFGGARAFLAIAGLLQVTGGYVLLFFGFKYFRFTIFMTGFAPGFLAGSLAYASHVVAMKLADCANRFDCPTGPDDVSMGQAWTAIGIGCVVGFILGKIFMCMYKLSIFLLGAFTCVFFFYVLDFVVLCSDLIDESESMLMMLTAPAYQCLIKLGSDANMLVLSIGGFVVFFAGGCYALKVEKVVIVVSTAFSGATIALGSFEWSSPGAFLAVTVLLAIAGGIVQAKFTHNMPGLSKISTWPRHFNDSFVDLKFDISRRGVSALKGFSSNRSSSSNITDILLPETAGTYCPPAAPAADEP